MTMMAPPPALAALGRDMLTTIRREYYLPESKLYSERPDRKQPAFNWGVGVLLSALNAAAKHDATFVPWLREYADASRVYWNKGGYDVLPAPKPLDRYYDDNAWMALALVETHEVLGDRKYLDWAKEALDFTLTGEAKDGGIYWRESDRASRNTCSNAPSAAACLAVYKHTKDAKLLAKARELYDWTRKHLQDPAEGLYWDNLANSGKLDKTKWSYNTALMIRTAAELRAIDPAFADGDDLKRMIDASHQRWFAKSRYDDVGRFAHLLLESWLVAGEHRAEYLKAAAGLHQLRNANGYVPPHWGRDATDDNPEILDQAAFARTCFVLAVKK